MAGIVGRTVSAAHAREMADRYRSHPRHFHFLPLDRLGTGERGPRADLSRLGGAALHRSGNALARVARTAPEIKRATNLHHRGRALRRSKRGPWPRRGVAKARLPAGEAANHLRARTR